jgi:trimethylamine--corrinoid protein Co-methyltransferase
MLHTIAGGEDKWRARPFVSMSNCFVVPPMKFAQDACRCLEAGVRGGMPILLLAAGQAGATSPAALAGAVVQEVAECLGALVYVNLMVPGHPAMFGPWPFVSDLRTGAMSGGSGEQAILSAACAQMAHFYDLSKLPDAQSGYEKGYTNALAGVAGANMIYESAGMHASLLGCCLESYVIDNDILGGCLRTVRGIEVTEDKAGPLPGPRSDPVIDADRIRLSGRRGPQQPQRMGGAGLDRHRPKGTDGHAPDSRSALSGPHRQGAG